MKKNLPDNILRLSLCLPLLPALIGARVGVLISVLVGVSTRCRVEAIAHVLTVCAPPHPVGPELHGHIQPLIEVLWSTIPAKDIFEVIATAWLYLGPEPRVGWVHFGGEGGNRRGRLYSWLGIRPTGSLKSLLCFVHPWLCMFRLVSYCATYSWASERAGMTRANEMVTCDQALYGFGNTEWGSKNSPTHQLLQHADPLDNVHRSLGKVSPVAWLSAI